MSALASFFGLLTFGLHFLVPLLGLILITVKGRGTARKLGIAGCAVIAGIALLQGIWLFAAPQLIESFGSVGTVTAYTAVNAAFSVGSAVGIGLVIVAVVAGRSGGQPAPQSVAQSAGQPPGPYYQPPNDPWAPR